MCRRTQREHQTGAHTRARTRVHVDACSPPALGWRAAVAPLSAPSADVLRAAVLCAGQPPVRSRAHTAHACARMSTAALTARPTRQWLVHRRGPFPHRHGDWAQLRPHVRLDRGQPAHMYLRRSGLGAAALGEWRHAFSPSAEVDVAAALSPSGHLARLKAAAARLAERCPPHQPPCGRALALRFCRWGRGEPMSVARRLPALALRPKSMRTRGCGPAAGGAGIGAGVRPLLRLPALADRSGSS
jgi:hypothetical protein